MSFRALAFLLIAAGFSATALAQPEPGAAPDACIRARADWLSVERSANLAVLQTYRDSVPAACVVQRALAEARMRDLGARAPGGAGDANGRVRVRYRCDNRDTVRVLFDYDRRTATVSRFARADLELLQSDAAAGFRYQHNETQYIEGEGRKLIVALGPGPRLACEVR
jgi:hypothetical protein